MNESEGEAAETQGWIEYGVKCGYLNASEGRKLHRKYDQVMGKLVIMGNSPERWLLKKSRKP